MRLAREPVTSSSLDHNQEKPAAAENPSRCPGPPADARSPGRCAQIQPSLPAQCLLTALSAPRRREGAPGRWPGLRDNPALRPLGRERRCAQLRAGRPVSRGNLGFLPLYLSVSLSRPRRGRFRRALVLGWETSREPGYRGHRFHI